jgi:hypothetical protein
MNHVIHWSAVRERRRRSSGSVAWDSTKGVGKETVEGPDSGGPEGLEQGLRPANFGIRSNRDFAFGAGIREGALPSGKE